MLTVQSAIDLLPDAPSGTKSRVDAGEFGLTRQIRVVPTDVGVTGMNGTYIKADELTGNRYGVDTSLSDWWSPLFVNSIN